MRRVNNSVADERIDEMSAFDWNNDGKHDWHDDALFHTVINQDSSSVDGDGGEFPTLYKKTASYSQRTTNHSSTPQHYTSGSSDAYCLVMIVIALTLFLCISALCMGYGNIIGDLLGFGVLAIVILSFCVP